MKSGFRISDVMPTADLPKVRHSSGMTEKNYMANLKDLINLAKVDGGKFFVIDEQGEARLVIMSLEDYQKLLLGKLQKQILDVERINREILEAQKKDQSILDSSLAKYKIPRVDLREEVIDPSFDFEAPKGEADDL